MQNSDLVEILSVLTEEEQKDLESFLSLSPKVRKECAQLVQCLLEGLNQADTEKIQKKVVYEKIFSGKEWVENKLPKLMGETLAHVRKFVAGRIAQTQMSELQQLLNLQIFYRERNLEDKFWTTNRQIYNSQNNLQWQTGQDYYTRFLSEEQVHFFRSAQNNRNDDLNVKNTIEVLDKYYHIERNWLICHFLNQNLVAPLDKSFPPDIFLFDLEMPSKHQFFQEPLGLLYSQTISLLSKEEMNTNPQLLGDFIILLRKYEAEIPLYCLNLFEHVAINYGVRHVNKGIFSFLGQVFEIQKSRVKSGRIYLESGEISATQFLSITIHALRLKEFDWAKDFIETHKKKVLGVMPSQQYYEFALANYLFHIKDYQETCRILMTSDYGDVQCKISGRILEIKALSEQFFREKADHRVGEYLEDRIEAAILFFFRHHEVEATKKKMGKRFADTMKRIIHAEGKRDVERLEIILQDIQKAEFIAERQWLTKLVEDLIAQHKKK